jgi:Fic family protein
LGIKIARSSLLKAIPLIDKAGKPFLYATPDPILRKLHEIDQMAGGKIQMSEEVTNPATRDRYILNSLIEESITSSQLEGASTTVEAAKQMLRSGRRPTDRSEQMIVNNYLAMHFVREQAGRALTPDLLFELHRVVTEQTLDDPAKAGRLRDDDDEIVIEDEVGKLLHKPPGAAELAGRLDIMCDFANDRPSEQFVHPVVRSVVLHFWIGYDHPFVDGNGRVARALFYWSMLREGYWLAEYLSISRILRKAPGKYARSFLHTETDDNDLTYFLEYHLGVIRRAIDELQSYLDRKVREVREVESRLKQKADLNHRQLALLSHAMRHPGARYTIQSHQRSHRVAYQTARTDLLELADKGLLRTWKRGKAYQFEALSDLGGRLERLGS